MNLSDRSSSANYGLKSWQIEKLVNIINKNTTLARGENGGRPRSLSISEMLLVTLYWLKNYPTYDVLSDKFQKSRTVVFEATRIIIGILADTMWEAGLMPARDLDQKEDRERFINQLQGCCRIDATERPIRRPKKNQKIFYSGKKKRHTVKNITIIDDNNRTIYLSPTFSGAAHDKKISDLENLQSHFQGNVQLLGDLGFQGLKSDDQEFVIDLPFKKPKNKELSETQKEENKKKASKRVTVEHSYSRIKQFKICSQVCRLIDSQIRDAVMLLAVVLSNFRQENGG